MGSFERLVAIAAIATVLCGCATSTAPGATGISRSQLLVVPVATINSHAALGYAKMYMDAKDRGQLNRNEQLTERARGIAHRLIREVGVFRPDATSWGWEVNVFESEELNAFCWPGGKIGINTGLITRLQLTDDELAMVVGHEIAHALREHGREKASQHALSQAVVTAIANSNARYARDAGVLAKYGAQFFVHLPFSRDMEVEADILGLELMSRAGFDPANASSVWRKMQQHGGSQRAEFFNTHPTHERRIAELEASIPKVAALYAASRGVPKDTTTGPSALAPVSPPAATSTQPTGLLPVSPTLSALRAQPAAATAPAAIAAIGQESYQVDRMARTEGCNANPKSLLTGKGPGFETYSVSCSSGDIWSVRCEYGQCRVLK